MSGDAIVVLGAGPAGVVAARGLAATGFAVTVVATRPAKSSAAWLEGLSTRAVEALSAAGCRHALATLGAPAFRSVVWNGRASAANREVLADRHALDEALLEDAREAGVVFLEARVESVTVSEARCRVVAREPGGAARAIDADCVVEARGRAAPSPPGARRGPETIAIGGFWRARRAPRAATSLVPFERGWCWIAELGDGRVWVQLATPAGGGSHREALADLHRTSVAALAEAAEIVDASSPPIAIEARSATAILSAAAVGDHLLRIGDAAFAPDPLSGSGLFEAIASALAVVPVATTIVRDPARRTLALRFHAERVEETFDRLARVGRDFHRLETRWSEAPFWRERASWPDDRPAHPAIVRGEGRIERRPVARDGEIVEEEVLVTPDHLRGAWRIGDVPVAPLLRRAAARRAVDDHTLAREHAAAEGTSFEATLIALDWLRRRGLPRDP